jgi:hypothetical protein
MRGWLSFMNAFALGLATHLLAFPAPAQAEKRVALALPPCNMKDPSAIPYDAKPYLKRSPTNQFVSVELTYCDGSISEIKSFRR